MKPAALILPMVGCAALLLFACDEPSDPIDPGPDAAAPLNATTPCPVSASAPVDHREADLFMITSAGGVRFEGEVEVKGSETGEAGVRLLEEIPTGHTLPQLFRLKAPEAAAPEVGAILWATLITDGEGAAVLVLSEAEDRPPSLIAVRGPASLLGDPYLTDRAIQLRPFGFCEPVAGACYEEIVHQEMVVDLGQGAVQVFAGQPMEIARAGQAYTILLEMAREVKGDAACPGVPGGWYELIIHAR